MMQLFNNWNKLDADISNTSYTDWTLQISFKNIIVFAVVKRSKALTRNINIEMCVHCLQALSKASLKEA